MAELITITDADGKTQYLKIYNGHKWHSIIPGNVKDHLDKVKKLKIRTDDVFVWSFPRCGLHWTREIVNMLQRGEATYIDKSVDNMPIEVTSVEIMDNWKSPRPLFTHAPFEYLPEEFVSRKGKIINVTRNPKDCAVSFYILLTQFTDGIKRSEPTYSGSWAEYLKMWYSGNLPNPHQSCCGINVEENENPKLYEVPYGGFAKIHQDIENAKRELNYPIHTVYYEDLQEDPVREIKNIADFLEVPYTDELIRDIARQSKFSNMQKSKAENLTDFTKDVSVSGTEIFFRKGKVGDWKNWFTVAQNEEFDKWYAENFKDSSFKHRFSL